MSFRPRVIVIAALLLPAVVAGCAAAPETDPQEPSDTLPTTSTTVPGVVTGGVRNNVTTSTTPAGAAATTTTTAPGGSSAARFPGDVAPGAVRWGAAIGGNSDPARHESVARTNLGLRRTFYSWKQRTGSMVSTARADLAAGRLPWVSIKPPSWAAMANGTYDAQIDEMLRALDALNGPVWLTVHHEPEGGGGVHSADDPAGPAAWRAMQLRVRLRMNALHTDNIAFAPILMAWTFDSRSGRVPADWWVDGIWDFVGIDHYQDSLAATSVLNNTWSRMYAFVSSKGMKLAIGEWGNRGTDGVAAAEMQQFYDFAAASGSTGGAQVIGLSYFDSTLNSPSGGWELFGEPLNRFRQIMNQAPSVNATEVR